MLANLFSGQQRANDMIRRTLPRTGPLVGNPIGLSSAYPAEGPPPTKLLFPLWVSRELVYANLPVAVPIAIVLFFVRFQAGVVINEFETS